jgi:hypothetical protein
MNDLIKVINRFSGNLCFVGSTDAGDAIIECTRSGVVTYNITGLLITDICLNDFTSYLVAFSNGYIGRYSNGTLDPSYISVPISNIDKIVKNNAGDIYILNRSSNQLSKYNVGILWTIDLPDYALRYDSNILLREADQSIIYYNNASMHLIRSDAHLLGSLSISGSGNLRVLDSNIDNKSFYIRARHIDAQDVDQSSSSSLSSSSSSISSYIENWSSSSSSSSSGDIIYATGFNEPWVDVDGVYYYSGMQNGKPAYLKPNNRSIFWNGFNYIITPAINPAYVMYIKVTDPTNPVGDYQTCPDNSTCEGGSISGSVSQ